MMLMQNFYTLNKILKALMVFAFIFAVNIASNAKKLDSPPESSGKDLSQHLSWATGINLSTFGPGVSVSKHLQKRIALRLSYNYFSYSYPLNKLSDELQGDALLQLGGPSLSLDYYFFKKLYLSGGVKYNQTNAEINGQMSESVFIGDIEMYPDELGIVNVGLDTELKFVPYVGLGYGGGFSAKKKIFFALELGAFYHGKPQVDLITSGMLEPTSSVEQEDIIENNIAPLKIWPMLTFRLNYIIRNN